MKFATAAFLAAALCSSLHSAAQAENYPSRPIRLVVPFAPGGNVDVTARVISQKFGEILGQPVVIDNKAGGGGSIGAAAVAKSPPDGYTLLMGASGPLSINPIAMPNLAYDAVKDFAPVAQVHVVPLVVLAKSKTDFASVQQLIEKARAKPNAIGLYDLSCGTRQSHFGMAGANG